MKTTLDTEPVPPGDDVCPVPAPVNEEPPLDRFCDLVLTGGVASGVVYPWAIVELARAFRFRSIGGTSVGAMAAALAAAAEYGRRHGFDGAFEPLRRIPAALGEDLGGGRTRLLSLFQSNPRGARLLRIWGQLGRGRGEDDQREPSTRSLFRSAGRHFVRAYGLPLAGGGAIGAGTAWLCSLGAPWLGTFVLFLLVAIVGAALALAWAVWSDLQHGVIDNGLGLCKGGTFEPQAAAASCKTPALCEWLHEGIQRSAGLSVSDPPLTFRDLWSAPAYPGADSRACGDDDPSSRRSIDLMVLTTNVTHGRPYRLPLTDPASRLFFDPEELEGYFPPAVLEALVANSKPYDRPSGNPIAGAEPESGRCETERFRELPRADLPLVVAARLSLSFPLLFSAVPLWAIDYEAPKGPLRTIRRCQFTDGGASSNFPIHLFDAALPRWPTFGLWLDRRLPYDYRPTGGSNELWLPKLHEEGRGDNWRRFDPKSAPPFAPPAGPATCRSRAAYLWGFLRAIATGAVDWRDRTSFRLPHVRNRVARLFLKPGEGGLNIGMDRKQILRMAHCYGTSAGRLFVERFADQRGGLPSLAWSEHRWVRLQLLISGLRERLEDLAGSAAAGVHSVPMSEAIQCAVGVGPIRGTVDGKPIPQAEAESLDILLAELQRLEIVLREAEPQSFKSAPEPELRLRPPL